MKVETYRKYRTLFESRYGAKLTLCGDSVLQPMLRGIRHSHLFFMIYCYDRGVNYYSQGVSSIDKDIRYYTFKGISCTRIKKPTTSKSMIDKFDGYHRLIDHCTWVLKSKGIKA